MVIISPEKGLGLIWRWVYMMNSDTLCFSRKCSSFSLSTWKLDEVGKGLHLQSEPSWLWAPLNTGNTDHPQWQDRDSSLEIWDPTVPTMLTWTSTEPEREVGMSLLIYQIGYDSFIEMNFYDSMTKYKLPEVKSHLWLRHSKKQRQPERKKKKIQGKKRGRKVRKEGGWESILFLQHL